MRVLSVAFHGIPVGTPSAGGAEQILAMLDTALAEHGHQSVVIAAPGSRISGELIESSWHGAAVDAACGAGSFDLIHFHGFDFMQYVPQTGVPMLATLHLPFSYYPENMIGNCLLRGIALNCVSRNQAGSAPGICGLPIVPNGIPIDFYAPEDPGDYLLCLGRICPAKGTHAALEVARRLDMRLIIAGPVHPYPSHRHYFAQCIEPWLDDKRTWVGAVGIEQKRTLLARARCVLVPSFAAETSSLVTMEALACGTPVVAFRQGALPEIVEDGETGFIVDSIDDMACAVARAGALSRTRCREQAIARFDSRRMVDGYFALYRQIITRHFSTGRAPHESL